MRCFSSNSWKVSSVIKGIVTREIIAILGYKIGIIRRSEKVKFKCHVLIHVYRCFLCLNLKIVTLPAEKETIFMLQQNVFDRIFAMHQNVYDTILRCKKLYLISFKYEDVLCTLSIVCGDDLGAATKRLR